MARIFVPPPDAACKGLTEARENPTITDSPGVMRPVALAHIEWQGLRRDLVESDDRRGAHSVSRNARTPVGRAGTGLIGGRGRGEIGSCLPVGVFDWALRRIGARQPQPRAQGTRPRDRLHRQRQQGLEVAQELGRAVVKLHGPIELDQRERPGVIGR